MKPKDFRSIESILKEYSMKPGRTSPTPVKDLGLNVAKATASKAKELQNIAKQGSDIGAKFAMASSGKGGSFFPTASKSIATGNQPKTYKPVKAKDLKLDDQFADKEGKPLKVISPHKMVSTANPNDVEDVVLVQDPEGKNEPIALDPETDIKVSEGKLSKIASRKGKKLKVKDLKAKIKKLSRKRLKEAPAELFEINFNKKEVAQEALDMPVRCGFEAETFFYNVSGGSGEYIDDMSVSDFEYEYGDLPDSAYEYYEDWLREKAADEYLEGYIDSWISENRDEDEWIDEFMTSGDGPTMDAVEEYRDQMKEDDPAEYENREEDGWDDDNWARDFINEEYETEYISFLEDIAREDDDVFEEALEEARSDYSMDEYVSDQYYSLSSFLDDFGVEYNYGGSLEGVAEELNSWIKDNSKYDDYPETGDYGDTYTTTGYAVETDSSIDADEGKGAELISPVFESPREMLSEMKSLFGWAEDNFGTNSTTGLHVTMSWQGEPRGGSEKNGPNKVKMALLLGDLYLLKLFNRLSNSYTRSQYKSLLKQAEKIKQGDMDSFLKLQSALEKGVSPDKMMSIHFKDSQKDDKSGNQLIEFRIMGGTDYQNMYEHIVKTVIRYATVMKAGYDDKAYLKDYGHAMFRLLKKAKEIDPKELEQYDLESPILQSAKNIAGKSDVTVILHNFDVSVINLREYEQISQPDADKQWKQEIADYEKGTGEKVEIEEAPVEIGEPITGYIMPSAIAPSRRAPGVLQKAQKSFARGLNLLAQNIAEEKNLANPKAKDIANFRKYIKQLSLNDQELAKIIVRDVRDDDNNASQNDAIRLQMVKKGIAKLLRKDIIEVPDFFKHQDLDRVVDSMWQFFQTDDAKDNKVIDDLANLFTQINPRLKNRKPEVHRTIVQLSKKRQKNDLFRYIKDAGYGADVSLLSPNMISDSKAISKLLKFLEPYQGYDHPTSRDHHVNLRSDDDYAQVFQYSMVQKLRNRLNYLKNLSTTDKDKYADIKERLLNIGDEFLRKLKPEDAYFGRTFDGSIGEGPRFLSIGELPRWNNMSDRLVKIRQDEDETTYNFPQAYDDYVLGSINLESYYNAKKNEEYREVFKDKFVKDLIKKRFKALKEFLTSYDKIFREEGFSDLKNEISGKNQLIKRNKDFEKNVRDNAKATLNIPSHSYVYLNRDFYDTITDDDYGDRAAYLDSHLDEFNNKLNSGGKVYVIPAAHFGQAEDALSGLELIETMEGANNYYHSWRKSGYKDILLKFRSVYNIDFNDLVYGKSKTYFQAGGDEYAKLQRLGIEITRKGDSRTGEPGQSDLVDRDELRNPRSDEPIDRGSAMMWNQGDDLDKELKRFNAFDWSVYPEKMKGLVAKDLKGMKDREGYYSFKIALENVLKQVLDGDIDLALNYQDNVEGMVQAAGVEDYKNASSSEVADKTNWNNLARYLKLNLGVNDQGVNLLKRVYDQYDSDHNWRPEDPRAIGTERWAAAVKAAFEYIQKNYKVSAGNYFRKDADGNAGDDVSSIYSKQRDDDSGFDVTTQDYDDMRSKYPDFNTMMVNGMQNYILRPDTNRLVSFLKQPKNDETFKRAVLVSMQREREAGEEPNDFQGHLARARLYLQNRMRELNRNESVFTKFDKLTLEEQLIIVNESEVLEKWSKKYKDSINCSNPKGFSQKAHCAGKKKKTKETIEAAQDLNALMKGIDSDLKKRKKDSKKLANKSVYERPLTKDEKKDKEKYVKGMKKNTKDFKKRYGKDAKAVMYATATKMAKESISENVSEGPSSKALPDNSIPGLLNDILSQPFPAWDLKKQFLAYYAVPDPQMLSDFRYHRATHGDNACLRGILRFYIQKQLDPRIIKKINLNEQSKSRVKEIINESRGLYGRLPGDKFKRENTEIEFQDVTNYPEIGKFEDADKRDEAISQLESQIGSQIEWMNIPNKGSLGFAIATLTNTENNEKMFWGRYFREITPNMMGKWSNKEVPPGWQLQHNTALKMEAGLDPQHLIATGKWIGNTDQVIQLIKENGGDNPVVPKLINALQELSSGNMPNFENEREQLPAIRDYFGEIMGPIALRGGLDSNGQSETARQELLDNANWNDCQVRWPQEMNYALVDSLFKGPNGAEVGISSKGGKGASAGVTNIAKAMERASEELLQSHSKAVEIIKIINDNSALNGPFRLAEYFGFLPEGLEQEINSYIQQVKKDFTGLSKGAKELLSGKYGEVQDPDKVPGFNTGFALMSKLAKKITMHINTNIPEFSDGCLAFLNQSAIVQLYCKMGVKGPDTFVAEWRSVYPPQFAGKILLDSGKTYYSSRIGSKFSFKFS